MALPKVGVQAVLELKAFERAQKKYEKTLDDMLRKTQEWARGTHTATRNVTKDFNEFLDKSRAIEDVFRGTSLEAMNFATQLTQGLGTAFQALGKDAEINIDLFDKLISQGRDYGDAFAAATGQTGAFSLSLGTIATGAAAASLAVGAFKKLLDESIESYKDLAEETRQITLRTGLAAEEASLWAKAAEIQNVSARSLAAGFAQLSRNLTTAQLKIATGKEDTSKFSQVLRAFGIDLRNIDGTFKSTSQIITEVNEKIRELGPGWQATGVAQMIYGRGAANLLPIILDEAITLEELTRQMREQGAILTEFDQKQLFDKARESSVRLDIAWQGINNTMSRKWLPTLTKLEDAFASLLEFMNKADIVVSAFAFSYKQALAPDPLIRFLGPLASLVSFVDNLTTKKFADTFQAEMERLKGLTEDAVQSENNLTKERKDAINALFAETDAVDDLNDVLEDQKKIIQDLTDAWDDYEDKVEDVNRRFDDQLEDQGIRESRDRVKRNLQLTFKLEDIYIKRGRRLRELEFKHVNDIEDVRRNTEKKLLDFERNAARAREKIWVKHRENLIKIENTFNDTVDEAARTNDTVAVVRAIRTRNRQLRDETRRYSVEQDELEKDLAIKRDRINEDAEERKNDLRNRIAEQRAIIERQYRDEIDDLIRKNKRELILSRNKDRERRADIERNRDRALRDAQIYYEREKVALQTHLQELNVIAVLAARGLTQEMVQVAADAMASLAAISAGPIDASPGASIDTGTGTEIIGGVTSTLLEEWRRRRGKSRRRAHGGMDVVNRPTTFVAGEAGAEIAAFIPLSQSRNINHNFGKLPIDFQGLPGGMDTGQVESIVYGAMMELARTLAGSRRS